MLYEVYEQKWRRLVLGICVAFVRHRGRRKVARTTEKERAMIRAKAAIVAGGLLLFADVGPAGAVDSGRAPRNDEGSVSDLCNQFKHEYQRLRDKQQHGTLTRDDRNRMRDLEGQIKSMCEN